jgi:hypothetical protein
VTPNCKSDTKEQSHVPEQFVIEKPGPSLNSTPFAVRSPVMEPRSLMVPSPLEPVPEEPPGSCSFFHHALIKPDPHLCTPQLTTWRRRRDGWHIHEKFFPHSLSRSLPQENAALLEKDQYILRKLPRNGNGTFFNVKTVTDRAFENTTNSVLGTRSCRRWLNVLNLVLPIYKARSPASRTNSAELKTNGWRFPKADAVGLLGCGH